MFPVSSPFRLRGVTASRPCLRFQSPPPRTQSADFPHYAHLLVSPQGLCDLSCWGDFQLRPSNPVAIEQLEVRIQPPPTPPRPAEALALSKRQDVSAFALTYSLRLRSCKLMDAFVISSLPSRLKETLQAAGSLRSTGVTPLPRSYRPDRHPHAFGRFPGFAGYTTYLAPVISHPGREGFTIHSVCPCHRAVASTPPRWECRIGVG